MTHLVEQAVEGDTLGDQATAQGAPAHVEFGGDIFQRHAALEIAAENTLDGGGEIVPRRPHGIGGKQVERLAQIGVRYVVWLDGQTRKTDGGGSIACGAGPGGAGCIGVGWWEKESGYVASVWDLQSGSELGSVSTDVTGTSVLIGAVAPIPKNWRRPSPPMVTTSAPKC